MGEAIIAKIEYFLFDILGLAVPGIIFFFLLILMPICICDIPLPPEFLSGFSNNIGLIKDIIIKLPFETVFLLIIGISYIVGHVINLTVKRTKNLCS